MVTALREELTVKENAIGEMKKAVKEVSTLWRLGMLIQWIMKLHTQTEADRQNR